jgi:hypothetical protein
VLRLARTFWAFTRFSSQMFWPLQRPPPLPWLLA